jgi:glycerol 3-phosphatase-2
MGLGKGAGSDHLMIRHEMRDAAWAFDAYETIRPRLPTARFPAAAQAVAGLDALADAFDVFLLDAFGVLNVGEAAIPGASERVAALQAAGKRVIVVSNAASYPKRVMFARYARLGFHFAPQDVLSSREVLLAALHADPPRGRLGLMAPDTHGFEEFEVLDLAFLGDDPAVYAAVDGFLMLGTGQWNAERQGLLEAALTRRPRPVWVGNPDLVAPRETGLSLEPGYYAHLLADRAGVAPVFYGKPFGNIFAAALDRAGRPVKPERTVMVGDTLQTDILGGKAAGFATALITGFGALKDLDTDSAIARSGIVPDFVMPAP